MAELKEKLKNINKDLKKEEDDGKMKKVNIKF